MTSTPPPKTLEWPLGVPLLGVSGAIHGHIKLRPGITTLVGPNGSGKTRALRSISSILSATPVLAGKKRRFLSAGRASPFEQYRSAMMHPGHLERDDAAVGNASYLNQWSEIESVTGDIMALSRRADLKLKVEARLQQLLDRSIELQWSQSGLSPRFSPLKGGGPYPANVEASGILQLVALLAAIHNDEIGALLIDEPEISLHPQHQAFLLEEMATVAGDPAEPNKKLIIIATHAPGLLSLRAADDLPGLVFFNDIASPPKQVEAGEALLRNKKVAATVARLGATHRMAMFAQRVLLVEGPSDEIVAAELARSLGTPLMARNVQILPVGGKGQFPEVAKLFTLMGKTVAVLADLDALADDNTLVNFFSNLPSAETVAGKAGHGSVAKLDRDLRTDLVAFMGKHKDAVDEAAAAYPAWFKDAAEETGKKRLTLARVLTSPKSFGGAAAAPAEALSLRYQALLGILGELGCYILRAGAIENYFVTPQADQSKLDAATLEAASFSQSDKATLKAGFQDVDAALTFISPTRAVDENLLLRPKLAAVLGAVFQSMTVTSPDAELLAVARGHLGQDAVVFGIANRSTETLRKVEVSMASPLFDQPTFPFVIGEDENLNEKVRTVLPARA
ncbi:AAA family ATPase [Caulobacter segnis]|uniref:ATP-dependent nuclease n=1 Tax=Caulobacter segnis TaxID=88688 RepID=UPI00241089AE|nr:AAA family ATPase [Caulobacter segnis]MDG2522962.1 AAA family ATPase [Caulobacter segnis]